MSKHPMQKIERDEQGVIRFRENAIVRFLLDNGPYNLNKLAVMGFSREDQEQFAQLIGYLVCGFGELGYPRKKSVRKADRKAAKLAALPPSPGLGGE